MYEDKTLVCKDCGNEFVFTAGEQEFYAEKGFENEPLRCKALIAAKLTGFLLNREMTSRYIAVNALHSIKTTNNMTENTDRHVLVCIFCFTKREMGICTVMLSV